MSPAIRPDVRLRFLEVVARGIERADREAVAHLARLAASRPPRRGPQAAPIGYGTRRLTDSTT